MSNAICFHCERPLHLCDCKVLAEFEAERKRLAKRQYPVVQIDPKNDPFGGCFATVVERTRSGLLFAYIQIPGKGQFYVYLNDKDYNDTGGEAIWAVDDSNPENAA